MQPFYYQAIGSFCTCVPSWINCWHWIYADTLVFVVSCKASPCVYILHYVVMECAALETVDWFWYYVHCIPTVDVALAVRKSDDLPICIARVTPTYMLSCMTCLPNCQMNTLVQLNHNTQLVVKLQYFPKCGSV